MHTGPCNRLGKAAHGIPAVRSCKDLNIASLSGPQDHLPEIPLHAVVDAVFRFVHEEESIAAVC